jgi:RNA polymerase sigma-70 factor (ECF subfamily)
VNLEARGATVKGEERRLVRRYLGGDVETVRLVESWIRRALDGRFDFPGPERQDLRQAVHVKLLANLRQERFRYESTLGTYVTRITHYTAIDYVRRKYRERQAGPVSETEPAEGPHEQLSRREETKSLYAALQQSSPECLELWRLIFVERLPYHEVAQRLGIPEGTVKSRAWHCRRKLVSVFERLRRRGRYDG